MTLELHNAPCRYQTYPHEFACRIDGFAGTPDSPGGARGHDESHIEGKLCCDGDSSQLGQKAFHSSTLYNPVCGTTWGQRQS